MTAPFHPIPHDKVHSSFGGHDQFTSNSVSLSQLSRHGVLRRRLKRFMRWPLIGTGTLTLLGYTSILVVPLVLAIWLPLDVNGLLHADMFEGKSLGGSLTLSQAKAVDFCCSAILAPLVLSVFNYVWFANARASLTNDLLVKKERPRTKDVSLYALVEASNTSIGSYDMIKMWTLCHGTSRRFRLLAILTISAALAQSSLSNIIAYEAFSQTVDSSPVLLRSLAGPRTFDGTTISSSGARTSTRQQKLWAHWGATLQWQLRWQNMTNALDADTGAYIVLNATSQALDGLDGSITKLYNVPASQATINCTPHPVQSLEWTSEATAVKLQFDGPRDSNTTGWHGQVNPHFGSFYQKDSPQPNSTSKAYLASHTPSVSHTQSASGAKKTSSLLMEFLALDNIHGKSIYAGTIFSHFGHRSDIPKWNKTLSQPVESPFGRIQTTAFNLTEQRTAAVTPCETAMSNGCMVMTWGLVCRIEQRMGSVDLIRGNASGDWTPTNQRFRLEASPVQLPFAPSQALPASWANNVFGSSATCGAVSDQASNKTCKLQQDPNTYNFTRLASNLLYLNMELQRLGYELAALDTSVAAADLSYHVQCAREIQRYQITYIPVLLIAGLLALALAAGVTTSLMIFSSRPKSLDRRQFRMIDSLRLLMDSAASLRHETIQYEATKWSTEELESWAKKHTIGYEARQDSIEGFEQPRIVLIPVIERIGDR